MICNTVSVTAPLGAEKLIIDPQIQGVAKYSLYESMARASDAHFECHLLKRKQLLRPEKTQVDVKKRFHQHGMVCRTPARTRFASAMSHNVAGEYRGICIKITAN